MTLKLMPILVCVLALLGFTKAALSQGPARAPLAIIYSSNTHGFLRSCG